MEELLRVGVITSTHGIRGEVKVFPTTDDPGRFKKLREVLLDTGKEKRTLAIEQVKFSGKYVILKFREHDRIEDVEGYRNLPLLVRRKQAVKLQKDEYFIADLVGMQVFTEDGLLGTLKDVIKTGANDVYEVEREKGADVLIPAIRQCIRSVNVREGRMEVRLLEGLLEEEPNSGRDAAGRRK